MQKQILKQMQKKLQESIDKVQEELGSQIVEGSAGNGAVRVEVNGRQQIMGIHLDPKVVDPQAVDLLEDLIMTAVKDAMDKSQSLAGDRMSALTGSLNIPGMPKIF
jgi:DNA-binding YbaB/EbfC family protein